MSITSIKIKNFRNLQNVDVRLGRINVLTGKNGSGKTNLLNALSHCFVPDEQLGRYFNNNITTKGVGKRTTTWEVTESNPGWVSMVESGDNDKSKKLYMPDKVTFSNLVGSSECSSISQEFKYRWRVIDGFDWDDLDFTEAKKEKAIEYVLRNDFWKFPINDHSGQEQFFEETSGVRSIDWNKIMSDKYGKYFLTHASKSIISSFFKKQVDDVWVNEISSRAIIDYVQKIPAAPTFEMILKRIKQWKKSAFRGRFTDATFPYLVADIQSDPESRKAYYRDLELYTNWLVEAVYIKTWAKSEEIKIGADWVIYVKTPNAPKTLDSLSAGSAVLIFFITIKNWLKSDHRSYSPPSLMLFDEIDSCIHPSLLIWFVEVLRNISARVQLVFTTHSPTFIDLFEKSEILYVKPKEKIEKIVQNRSDVFTYEQVLSLLSAKDAKLLERMSNSDLFVNGMIDDIYPVN